MPKKDNFLQLSHLADYYEVYPDLVPVRESIIQLINEIIENEGGPVVVDDVWIVPEKAYLGRYFGTTILTKEGFVVLRVAIKRSVEKVVDTILHEAAHILLGKRHIKKINHGRRFKVMYDALKERYTESVLALIR